MRYYENREEGQEEEGMREWGGLRLGRPDELESVMKSEESVREEGEGEEGQREEDGSEVVTSASV